jgi:hypothetical protein
MKYLGIVTGKRRRHNSLLPFFNGAKFQFFQAFTPYQMNI